MRADTTGKACPGAAVDRDRDTGIGFGLEQLVNRADAAQTPDLAAQLELDGKGRSRRRRRWLWVAGVLVLAVAAGFYGYKRLGADDERVTYTTLPAERGTITVQVNATGTLQPLVQVDISSELSGVIRTVAVEENQQVKKGDVLAELDKTRFDAELDGARATVDAARAKLADAEITRTESSQAFARAQSLTQRGMATQQSLESATATRDRAEAAVSSARASLLQAEASLKLAEANVEKSTIYAPIDGVVLTRSVNPGQTVAASTQAPVLFVLAADLSNMELQASIDEADIGGIQKGQDARFTVDAFPERQFEAAIRDIAYASATTDNVVTYKAKLDVDNAELLLRPGMTATVSIVTHTADNVLTVPNTAFRFRPATQQSARGGGFSILSMFTGPMRGPGGRPPGEDDQRRRADQAAPGDGSRLLFVLKGGRPEGVRVKTGVTDGDLTEIVSGLSEGDAVVTGTAAVRN